MITARYASLLAFAESRGDAPAPPKDRIKGSDVNDEGSAKNKSGDISLDESTISAIKAKAEEHNAAMRERKRPDWTHVRLPALKAVYRRGAGAFSTSHRPGMTRDRWAMARVNAFLVLARRGRPENSKYVGDNDLLNAKHPRYSTQSRSADCGREDDGKFASGNKCGGQVEMPKEDPRGRMRYDNGVQTDAARKLYQMGSSEKKLKALVDVMGGDAKNTRVDINPPSLNISVADKDGNKLYHVDFENGRARLYPAKDLSPAEASKIKDAATEAFGGTQADTKITVYRKADDMKKWQAENDAKIKKWEDKYKFSTLLPPHQRPKKWERSIDARYASLLAFAESRDSDCGRDPDGKFGGGNKCASAQPKSLEQQRLEAAGTFSKPQEKSKGDKVEEMKGYLRLLGHGWADFVKKAQSHNPDRIKNANHAKSHAAHVFATEGAAGFDRYLEQIGMRSIEVRDCGQDSDGKFSKGNTCASGMAADAAKGAAKGAAVGAVSGFAKTFLPQGAATGAAAGAVAGAVKGIYDNKMRPTRVSERIKKLGMTDEKVAGLVKGLGGTSKSLASTNGRKGLTLTIRGKGGKVTHVVDITDKKVSIYPTGGRKEMSDDQIATIKKVASDNAPKETSVVVKTNSLSYAARLTKKGFVVAAKGAGVLTATAIVAGSAESVPDAVLGVTDLVFDTHFTDSFYRKPDAKR